MRRLSKALSWLLLGLILLPLVAFVVLIPFLGFQDAGTAVGVTSLVFLLDSANRLGTALTFYASFDGGIPRSPVLASRSEIFAEDHCGMFIIERLPLGDPNAPENWTTPERADWQATPGRMMLDLTACDLDPDLRDALRAAQSEPGSFVMNSHHSFVETWL